ncbi:MAG: hypothetical protein A2901_04935 [Elusimicrobia bacterium RIFCSPLOWO2_01_FULL_54_10]|nr:MAG: hypothetical protein A2901_04935 [Elusimicrobia bacterium RIFCSPLOWO2_01_FULL_54_10]
MFRIELKPEAIKQLKKIKRFYAVQILDSIQKHLSVNPDQPSPPRIKILRGRQRSTYRLREGDYRIFYDIERITVYVTAILHKRETLNYYLEEDD